MKSFFRLLEKIAGPIGAITAIVGVMLDFLSPLGSYTYVLAAFLFSLTLATVICNSNKTLEEKAKSNCTFVPDFVKKEIAELWQPEGKAFYKKGLFQVLAFFTILSMAAGVYATENPKGFLATKLDSVAGLQSSLGLIGDRLAEISNKQGKIISTVEHTNQKLDLVKKETSENPRKELANLGIEWHEDGFWDAMVNDDKKAVELFVRGGFKINGSNNYSLPIYIEKNGDYKQLKYLADNGVLDKKVFSAKYKIYDDNQLYRHMLPYLKELDKKNKSIEKQVMDDYERKNKDFHAAIMNGTRIFGLDDPGPKHPEEAPYLMASNAEITPLMMAIWQGNNDLVKFIIALGVSEERAILNFGTNPASQESIYVTSMPFDYEVEAKKHNVQL